MSRHFCENYSLAKTLCCTLLWWRLMGQTSSRHRYDHDITSWATHFLQPTFYNTGIRWSNGILLNAHLTRCSNTTPSGPRPSSYARSVLKFECSEARKLMSPPLEMPLASTHPYLLLKQNVFTLLSHIPFIQTRALTQSYSTFDIARTEPCAESTLIVRGQIVWSHRIMEPVSMTKSAP